MLTQLKRSVEVAENTRWNTFFLARLERLVHTEPMSAIAFNAEHLRRRAIYLTYLECRERGLEDQARAILATQPADGTLAIDVAEPAHQ